MVKPHLMGVFGGTFDPVHYGHLRPAHNALQTVGLDEVRFIPSCQPVHRPQPWASPEQRLQMLRLAVADFDGFVVDDREIRRGGMSYTFETLAELRSENKQAILCLMMGMDALLGFTHWYRWRHILELSHLLVMLREGHQIPDDSDIKSLLSRHCLSSVDTLRNRPAGGIVLLSNSAEDISSTYIRSQLKNGNNVEGLLPPAVSRWLNQHSIYSTSCPVAS